MTDLSNILEAIIFASDSPVKAAALAEILAESMTEGAEAEAPGMEEIQATLDALTDKYADERYPFEVRKSGGGYQFYTKGIYHPFLRQTALMRNQKRLSRAALETLAIVAYRQPVTKSELEFIRGVNCDYALHKLLEKKLVEISGRAEAAGRPLLYSTSAYFLQYFGINGPEDLPKLKEFEALAEEQLEQFRLDGGQSHEVTYEAPPPGPAAAETPSP